MYLLVTGKSAFPSGSRSVPTATLRCKKKELMRRRTIAIACLGLAALSAGAQDKDVAVFALFSCGDLLVGPELAATGSKGVAVGDGDD